MPTITKLCFAIILSKLCLVEPSSTPHLAEDGWAKLWTQISSRSPEGERGWRSGTLMSEQVPVHFTRLPLFPYRALWAQLHPWTFTCFSVRILQACLNWLSQPSILRRRTGKKKSSVPAALSPCSPAPTRTPVIPAEVQRCASWSSMTAAISKCFSDTKDAVLVPQWRSAELHSSACMSSCHHGLPSGCHGKDTASSPHQGSEEKTHCCSGQSITSGTDDRSSITTESNSSFWLRRGGLLQAKQVRKPSWSP